MGGDHLLRQLVGHVVVVRELHRIRRAPLRFGGEVRCVAEHFGQRNLRLDDHVVPSRFAAGDAAASRIPFSTDGIHFLGIAPPKISSTNSTPLPRSTGSILIRHTPNCPCPPDCFLCLPSTSALPRMVSRYGTLGGFKVRSTW